jgi:hypothetical protein
MIKHLINEKPILVYPSLAAKIGLKESIVLNAIKSEIETQKILFDGCFFARITASDFLFLLPFFGNSSLKNTLESLENKGLVRKEIAIENPTYRAFYYSLTTDVLGD